MGIVGGGAMATHLVVPADQALPVPQGMPLHAAAALPEAFVTAWDALWTQAGLSAGEVALVHGAGSGIGTAAVQLVRARGAVAAGTSRSAGKLSRCAALGLEHALHVAPSDREHPARFAQALRDRTGGHGADVILDTVGAAYLPSRHSPPPGWSETTRRGARRSASCNAARTARSPTTRDSPWTGT
jgi:NADPH:quinone reductase-like Zn-dependent oxidoreductase